MELRALVCTARRPRCGSCPLRDRCRARTGIAGALAASPRAPRGGTATYRYEDSNRFWRGRVLARLREAPEGYATLRELGTALREGFDEEDMAWIRGVVHSLEKDGLATISGERPPYENAEAVAEERPAYGAEAKDGEPDGETRVRLP